MNITRHASQRLQQRAIPERVIDLLEEFGKSSRSPGADSIYFDKSARRKVLARFGGPRNLRHLERWFNTYAIIGDDGRIVTVGYRTKRFKNR